MALTKLAYNGDSKIIKNLVNQVNQLIDGGSGASSLVDLSDTNISNPSNGQVLGYDSSSSKWKNVNPPASGVSDVKVDGASVVSQGVANITTPDLGDLDSVAISSPTNGQVLGYDSQTQKWKNITGGSGNISDVKVNGVSVVDANHIAQVTSYKEVTLAEYQALPATKLTDGVAYFIKDIDNPSVEGYPPLIYSDEEREVGVWRDGKPLYQKSISIGAVTANTVKVIDITSLNVDYVADYIATAVLTNGWKVPLPQTHTSSMSYQAFCRLSSSTQLAVGVGSSFGISDGYVTLQYTKTTDTAGSGIWNGQGGIAHHYSTNETVIGTWIDGKPLYEKTIEVTNPTHGAWTQIVSDNNINIIGYINEASYAITQAGEKSSIDFCANSNLYGRSLIYNNEHSMQIEYYNPYGTLSKYIVTLRYTKTTD